MAEEIGIEEYYQDRQLVDCDLCKQEQLPERMHFLDTFDETAPTLLICPMCYDQLIGGH